MAVVAELFGATNLGIYNYRRVRGSAAPSVHGEGRAGDAGYPLVNRRANPKGWALHGALLPNVRALGIQLIIWDRRIWSAKAPLGAPYQGTVPHLDHLHIEFTWHAARNLTPDHCLRVLLGAPGPTPPPYRPPSTSTPPPYNPPGPAPFTPPSPGVPMRFFITDPAYGIRLVITDGFCIVDQGIKDPLGGQLLPTDVGGPMTPKQFADFCALYGDRRMALPPR